MALLETAAAPRRRRIGLTPMIDVVFLLLVFFMLASRFGVEGAVPISAAGSGGGGYEGAPRLVEARPDGFRLNGVALHSARSPFLSFRRFVGVQLARIRSGQHRRFSRLFEYMIPN